MGRIRRGLTFILVSAAIGYIALACYFSYLFVGIDLSALLDSDDLSGGPLMATQPLATNEHLETWVFGSQTAIFLHATEATGTQAAQQTATPSKTPTPNPTPPAQ